jgi:hypothetical protein
VNVATNETPVSKGQRIGVFTAVDRIEKAISGGKPRCSYLKMAK